MERLAQLEVIIETLDEAVSLMDGDLNLVAANRRFYELLEFPSDRFPPGTPLVEIFRFNAERGEYGPGDIEMLVKERMALARRFEPHCFERTRTDGRTIEVRGTPLPGGGFVTSYTDITGRRRSEEALWQSEAKFRNLIEGSIQGICIHRDWKVLFANQAMADIFGYADAEELISLGSLEMLVAAHKRSRMKEHGDARMRGEDAPTRHTAQSLRIDGSTVWVETVSHAVTWDNEPAIQSTVIDVTERKQAETALRERVDELEKARRKLERQGEDLFRLAEDLKVASEQAQAASRAKSVFLAAMSHELRTPLNAILGFSEVIKREALGPNGNVKYRSYAEDIHFSGQHLLDLINDILDLSKIESGAEELYEEIVEVSKVVDAVLRVVRRHAENGGLKLILDAPKDLPLLRADERKLKQILVNLLSNAIKFTEPGGRIDLVIRWHADTGFVFRVTDTGIGIAPADIPKALSQFGQIDGELNRKYEGTGLGLPLARSLTELHGGSIEVQSHVGVGTTVMVCFPAKRVAQASDDKDLLGGNHGTAG